MATLQQQLALVQKLNSTALSAELFKIIKGIEREIIDKNKEQISVDSTDVNGKPLGYYSQATQYITTNRALLGGRNNIKIAGQPYTGIDTGDWFDGFYLKVDNDALFFGSNDSKNAEILRGKHWLTTDFFGLTDENLREVIEQSILPLFISMIRQKLEI